MEKLRFLISASSGGAENYIRAAAKVGAESHSIYLPPVDLNYDGLILSGGGDIDPSYFGQAMDGTDDIDPERDAAEVALIRAYYEAGKPMIGICRGMQVINVALGGTLFQHLKEKTPVHRPCGEAGGDRYHRVFAAHGSWYEGIYGTDFIVNSYHHQAVDELAPGFKALLWSEDHVLEAMEHETLPILCTQFHPERLMKAERDPASIDGTAVFRRFADLCRGLKK